MVNATVLAMAFVAAQAPSISPGVDAGDAAGLRRRVAPVLALDEARLRALIPTQSGLYFVGCPNCTGGRQEGQLSWSLADPEVLTCRYCKHRYPSEKYPMSHADERDTPAGGRARYPYWANEKGYRHYFAAKLDDEKRAYFEGAALSLAQLYHVAGDAQAARTAAVIIARFAEVYPGYCYHYDYPFQQKEIYDGEVPPEKWRNGYRTARWTWWAYMDIPVELVRAYELVRPSGAFAKLAAERGVNVVAQVEQEFFRKATDQVLANADPLSNMSPIAWAYAVAGGRILGEPRYVHEPLGRLQRLLSQQFYYDGTWSEGAPSYHSQVMGALDRLVQWCAGYTDPPEYAPPGGAPRLDNLDLRRDIPQYRRCDDALSRMCLPDGRFVPVHDTWSGNRRRALSRSEAYLLGGLGHACLGGGEGAAQQQAHLTWSGAYGHAHGDGLSLLLHAFGEELLSDLGYTHTAYRAWTLTTLSHNLALVDGRCQALSGREAPTDGTLRWFDAGSFCQGVSVDNANAYPGLARTYRRTLVRVPIDEGRAYLVDRFDVAGGKRHEYALWGSADKEQSLALSPEATEAVETLTPPGVEFRLPRNEGDSGSAFQPGGAYGFLRGIRAAAAGDGIATATFRGAAAGLRASLLTRAGERLFAAAAPNIRGAGEDDTNLEKHRRAGLLWRREAEESRFVAVLEPFAQAPVAEVSVLVVAGCDAALRVSLPGGRRDLILLGARDCRSTVDGVDLDARGEVIVLSLADGKPARGWLAGPGWLHAGAVRLEAPEPKAFPLVALGESELVVAGRVTEAPGRIVMLRHGDGSVSPYTLRRAEALDGERTRLVVAESTGFELAADGTARGTSHPRRDRPGPHRAFFAPLAWSGRVDE